MFRSIFVTFIYVFMCMYVHCVHVCMCVHVCVGKNQLKYLVFAPIMWVLSLRLNLSHQVLWHWMSHLACY